jgi:hypothetical protein
VETTFNQRPSHGNHANEDATSLANNLFVVPPALNQATLSRTVNINIENDFAMGVGDWIMIRLPVDFVIIPDIPVTCTINIGTGGTCPATNCRSWRYTRYIVVEVCIGIPVMLYGTDPPNWI